MRVYHREKKSRSGPCMGFILSTMGSVPSNEFSVDLGTLNTFDVKDRSGTDVKVDDKN